MTDTRIAASGPKILPSLTGLRFFAALAVFLFHASMSVNLLAPELPVQPFADPALAQGVTRAFANFGFMGVTFFFVLTGFLITWTTPRDFAVGDFLFRRFLKIYPTHVAMWVVTMLAFAAATTTPLAGLMNLLLIHTLTPEVSIAISVNTPAWSLTCDVLFYLACPWLLPLMHRVRVDHLLPLLALVVAAMLGIATINATLVPDAPLFSILPLSWPQLWFGYYFPVPRLLEFVCGMIAARLLMAGRFAHLPLLPCLGAVVLSLVLADRVRTEFDFGVLYVLPMMALILCCASRDAQGRGFAFLHSKPMQWLGQVSFGFYMAQYVALFWPAAVLGLQGLALLPGIAAIGLYFGCCLLGGWMLHRLVEMPAMRLGKRLRPRKPMVAGQVL